MPVQTSGALLNTQVGGQGSITVNPNLSYSAAPGAQGALGYLNVTQSVLIVIGSAAVALVALGFVFRKGGK